MKFPAIDPSTGETLVVYPGHSSNEVEVKLGNAAKAQKQWSAWSFSERKKIMKRVASILRRRKKEFATLMTEEMGKPIAQSIAEVEKCAWACEHFAENAEKYLQPIFVKTEAEKSYVSFEPLGVILGVMPWNFPFWQVFRFAAPTIMAGNGIVLKHARNVPGCGLAIQEIFREAGVPKGLFASLLINSKSALALISDSRIAGVSVTGSTAAGKQIAAAAGGEIKPCVLELGGSDPFVVLDKGISVQDCADLAVRGRIINGGQSCIAAKRFIVPHSIARAFEKEMARDMDALQMGDPMDSNTDVGPLARVDLREALRTQMRQSIRMGARILTKRKPRSGKGFFFPPTLLTRIKSEMPVFSEETFGPLGGVMPYQTIREAIALANATPYGLGASLWSRDVGNAEEWARHIQAGNVFVNKNVASDPRLPFGGTKRSGLGKEMGEIGIKAFVNAKTIWVK